MQVFRFLKSVTRGALRDARSEGTGNGPAQAPLAFPVSRRGCCPDYL